MKKALSLIVSVTLLLSLFTLLPSAYADSGKRVFDNADLMSANERSSLEEHISVLEEKSGTKFYFVSHKESYRGQEYTADMFIRECGITEEDFILLTVVKRSYETNYYIDTCGDTRYSISGKEVNYVLDNDNVYDNIKYESVYEGAKAFFTLSERAYSGRLGASYLKIFTISLIISVIISVIVGAVIVAKYKKKQRQTKYPLDRFATLELTHSNDIFTGSYVTRRRIRRSGSSSGSGSGGSRRGGR